MRKRSNSTIANATLPAEGNYISEWLGHRIYPTVRLDVSQFSAKRFGTCPFLTEALRRTTECVKNESSLGVCSVSSMSNGPRQDWLVCPYRVMSSNLVREGCSRIFRSVEATMQPIPVTLLQDSAELERFKRIVTSTGAGYVFFQDKLGGEISVTATAKSPEMSFDVTLVEIVPAAKGTFRIARYGILEIQTMDFHGSYQHAVNNLRDALRLHKARFPEVLAANLKWAGEKVEGPNIANVFKRTFYQTLIKFQLSGKGAASGTVLAIPQAVWDSWQPFLGAPELQCEQDGIYRLKVSTKKVDTTDTLNALICVFDVVPNAATAISPVEIKMLVQLSAEELSNHAFKVVPAGMLKSISETDSILTRIRTRLVRCWPDVH